LRRLYNLLSWETKQKILEYRAWLKRQDQNYAYRLDDVTGSLKHTNPTRLIDRLLRHQMCLGEEIPFAGKTILEIGAGPLLGWSLAGVSLGAKKYYILDPAMDIATVSSMGEYFVQHRRYVQATFGQIDSLQNLISDRKIEIVNGRAEDTGLQDSSIDIVVSNSVLEHIQPFGQFVSEMRRVIRNDGLQYHFVDLKDHAGGNDPFLHMYPYSLNHLKGMFRRRGQLVNYLRPSDIEKAFRHHFDYRQEVFLQEVSHGSIKLANDYWKDRYSDEELGIELMGVCVSNGT